MFKIILIILFPFSVSAQNIKLSGFLEAYYSIDFQNPKSVEKEDFLYNHKRNGELALNLAMLKATFNDTNVRGNFGLMIGNYPQYNLSSEPTWAQFVYEANVGLRLSKKHNLWLDVGIFSSHIGFESALGSDCITLTRSILAENSPYYESGAKITYTDSKEKILVSFLVLNGWQRIQRIDSSIVPAVGFQIKYAFSNKFSANYSNYFGSSSVNSSFRTFHNFYIESRPNTKWHMIAGFDFGFGYNSLAEKGIWLSPVLITKYNLSPKSALAARVELYHDPKNNIIENNNNEFTVWGKSLNFDYSISKNILLRSEFKMYLIENYYFISNSKTNALATVSFIGKF